MEESEGDRTIVLKKRAQVFLHDMNGNRTILVFDGLTLGRSSGNVLFPEDPLVSKSHMTLYQAESGLYVKDLNSSNGTKVDGRSITPNVPTKVSVGTILEFGNQVFQIVAKGHGLPQAQGVGVSAPRALPRDPSFSKILHSFLNPKNWGASTIITVLSVIAIILRDSLATSVTCSRSIFQFPMDAVDPQRVVFLAVVGLVITFAHHGFSFFLAPKSLINAISLAALVSLFLVLTAFTEMDLSKTPRGAANFALCRCMKKRLQSADRKVCLNWKNGHLPKIVPFSQLPEGVQAQISERLALAETAVPVGNGLAELMPGDNASSGDVKYCTIVLLQQNGNVGGAEAGLLSREGCRTEVLKNRNACQDQLGEDEGSIVINVSGVWGPRSSYSLAPEPGFEVITSEPCN